MKWLLEAGDELYGFNDLDMLCLNITVAQKDKLRIGKLYERQPGIPDIFAPTDIKKMQIQNLISYKKKLNAQLAQEQDEVFLEEIRNQLAYIDGELKKLEPEL